MKEYQEKQRKKKEKEKEKEKEKDKDKDKDKDEEKDKDKDKEKEKKETKDEAEAVSCAWMRASNGSLKDNQVLTRYQDKNGTETPKEEDEPRVFELKRCVLGIEAHLACHHHSHRTQFFLSTASAA